MSLKWRQRVKAKKKRLMELLDLSQEDWDYYNENITEFCRESDEQIRAVYGENVDVDKISEEMDDYNFVEMAKEILKQIFKKLKRKTGKKKSKKSEKESEEQTEEETADTDEEKEEDTDTQEIEEPIAVST